MRISLVCMPFHDLHRPSIALSLLKAKLVEQGHDVDIIYLNHEYSLVIGLDNYMEVNNSNNLLGEWLFSSVAFPDFSPNYKEYYDLCGFDESKRAKIAKWRKEADTFTKKCAISILKSSPDIVGVSSLFTQHSASLGLLRFIKEISPSTITIIGGGNCEGDMGNITYDNCNWIDFVVSGEGEHALMSITDVLSCKKIPEIAIDELPANVLGPSNRLEQKSNSENREETDLNHLPFPIYSDYFSSLKWNGIQPYVNPTLPIEGSRGCWLVASPCTFCGLNGEQRHFRKKDPSRLIDEMRHLVKLYGLNKLAFTDNIINMDLFNSLFPEIEKTHEKFEMFFETPARLKRHQLDMLDRVGVRIIQPGIENLHDASLKLLNKKTTSWENIQLLKSCLEIGIHIAWNYLVKIPGDKDEWYSEMVEVIPLLMHLQPPKIIARVRFDRFGKYFHEKEKYGLQLKPLKIYKYFFPFSETEMNKFAYYFEDDLDDSTNVAPGLKSFLDIMAIWCISVDVENSLSRDNLFPDNYPVLQHFDTPESLEIIDTRPCAVKTKHLLIDNERIVYLNCLEKSSTEDVCNRNKINGKDIDRIEVDEIIDKLVNLKLILKKDGYYLALSTAKPKAPILRADILADGAVDTARYLSDRWSGAIPLEVSTYSKRKVLI